MPKQVIGLDVGATKTIGVVFDGKKVLRELTIVTPKNEAEFRRSIGKLLEFLAADYQISAIGIGMAGLMDPVRQIAATSPNMKFIRNFKWKKFLSSGGIRHSALDNDANCFLRGELAFGQAKRFKNVIGITLGTGIGGAVCVDGKMYRGAHHKGSEIGRLAMENSFWETLFQRARDKRDFKRVSRLTAVGLADLINIFDPEAIVIGGGFGINEAPHYFKSTLSQTGQRLSLNKQLPKIIISKLKNAAALGAASMVMNHFDTSTYRSSHD